MAIKVGTENKRNVIIAGVLFVVLAYLGISQLLSGPSTPKPAPAPAPSTTVRSAADAQAARNSAAGVAPAGKTSGPAAHQVAVAGSGLDPALHLEKLALSESIEYSGNGRNIFSADSAPVVVETAAASARPTGPVAPIVQGPPPVPQPPAIDLHYFGYSSTKDGKREAFLLHGEDIFEAAPGEIVNHRYKVVTVDLHSIQVTDLSYNNTQTLPLTAN